MRRYVVMKKEGRGLCRWSIGERTAKPKATHRPKAEEAMAVGAVGCGEEEDDQRTKRASWRAAKMRMAAYCCVSSIPHEGEDEGSGSDEPVSHSEAAMASRQWRP